MKEKNVILVNEEDVALGTMEKMEVHEKGLLHRAFSVFIFDSNGRMLLQQRAAEKYHGGLLWTNACCSHPYPDERTEEAAARRLQEEMGFSVALTEIFSFVYRADVENDLIEHEFDHVFAGEYEGGIKANDHEVKDYRYADMNEIDLLLQQKPGIFTTWFRIAFPRIKEWWLGRYT